MKSIYRYPGGKSKKSVREKILANSPDYYKEYREPFVGGGGIFFVIEEDKSRWINDLHSELIYTYTYVRDNYEDFIKLCRTIPTLKSNNDNKEEIIKKMKQFFDDIKFDEKNVNQALRYYFINRTNWMGRVNFDPNMKSRMFFSNPEGWNIIETDILQKASELLQGVKITSLDFSNIFEEDGDDVWIYADPPYVCNSDFNDKSKLYQHNFSTDDHLRLFDCIKSCKHKVTLSYDDDSSGFIRDLYKEYNINETNWKYCGTSSAKNQSKNKKNGKELIITNF